MLLLQIKFYLHDFFLVVPYLSQLLTEVRGHFQNDNEGNESYPYWVEWTDGSYLVTPPGSPETKLYPTDNHT